MLVVLVCSLLVGVSPAVGQTSGSPGGETLTITINDSEAGGSYEQVFEKVYAGTTTAGTDVYIYVPVGALDGVEGVASLDPAFDPNPTDAFVPCSERLASEYVLTQAQIDLLGDTLVDQIVAVNEDHFGEIGLADPADPNSDALVVMVYNVQDGFYYDCAEDTYTAGYFAPDFITTTGMNVIVIDAFDWENRVGGETQLYEGVIAHELEHLQMHYSDPGELSWVDEGLADFAVFLNGFPAGGSHLAYHQVFHRETSLTRWGGGLENYGASYSWFQYLWEQAGGNGDGTFEPDLAYDAAGGDLLIQLIFDEQADGMEGVQNAIDAFNALGHPGLDDPLRSVTELFQDWVVTVYLDNENSDRFDIKAFDFGDEDATWGYTIAISNEIFFNNRGIYQGAMPEAKWRNFKRVPAQTALPYGASYETFRNPGPTFSLTFDGDDVTVIAPHTGTTHWYAGYESQSDNILNVEAGADLGGQTLDFWTWYFIEEGWDYGYVEALVDGAWVTVPLVDDAGVEVTTNTNPHDNNAEGNGLTGTSGGAYFVDAPQYIHLQAQLPTGTTDVRFRYSTDAAYLDTGWFVDDVQIGGQPVALSSAEGEWVETTGEQDNNWLVQLISPCDLTPGVDSTGEFTDAGVFIYRLEGDLIEETGFSSMCLKGTKGRITVAISNLPTGDLTFLDAGYTFRITNTGNKP